MTTNDLKIVNDTMKRLNIDLLDLEIAENCLEYCKRKLVRIKKDESYLQILFQCELPFYIEYLKSEVRNFK